MLFLCVFVIFISIKSSLSVEYSTNLQGYSEGFLANCPTIMKPASIRPESLKKLGLIILGTKTFELSNGKMYNYYQANQMGKDPNLDLKNKKTLFFVGGWLDNPGSSMYAKVIGNRYKNMNYNVLIMQAEHFVIRQYPIASRMLRPVGFHIAEMLTNLTAAGLDPKDLHLVGISLGAHTMSFIAKNFYKLTGKKINRLTGLDPSGPCFRKLGPDHRLDKSDGEFVDVLFTNIDALGMALPVGHVHFYINGGEYQPFDIAWIPCSVICSHLKAFLIWFTAIRHPDEFIAVKCDSAQHARTHQCFDNSDPVTNLVGEKTDRNKTGLFYLITNNAYPYYLGKEGLKKKNIVWFKHMAEYDQDFLSL